MRTIMVLCILFAALSTSLGQSTGGTTYASSRVYFRETMTAGGFLLNKFESMDMEIVKIDMDLVGVNSPKQTLKMMSTGFHYVISAVGQPSRIKDLDLQIFYLNGESSVKIAEDKLTDNTPVIDFVPPLNGNYLINIEAASMTPDGAGMLGFYFLIIAHN